ncbi:hypothetical protein IPJ72_02305 [Candidatus Peregrinibacteria bacterium]|nr:MAG: hypothetical protein IPJ72_02305 [Candidatus Peregrinibacteria bacterium]
MNQVLERALEGVGAAFEVAQLAMARRAFYAIETDGLQALSGPLGPVYAKALLAYFDDTRRDGPLRDILEAYCGYPSPVALPVSPVDFQKCWVSFSPELRGQLKPLDCASGVGFVRSLFQSVL